MLRSSSKILFTSFSALLLVASGGCSSDDDTNGVPGGGSSSGGSSSGSSSGDVSSSGGNGSSSGGSSGTSGTAALNWAAATITGDFASNVGEITAMAYGAGTFVAFAKARILTVGTAGYSLSSTDGKTWTITQTFDLNYNIGAVTHVGASFVAVGSGPDGEGGTRPIYVESATGATWEFSDGSGDKHDTIVAIDDTVLWSGLNGQGEGGMASYRVGKASPTSFSFGSTTPIQALCKVGTRLLAAGAGGPDRPTFLYSDTPTTAPWVAGTNDLLRGQGSMLGLWCEDLVQVAVGRGNEILVSVDRGESWSLITEGNSTTWTAVAKAGDKIVAVGWNGAYGVIELDAVAVGTIGSAPLRYEVAASNGTTLVAAGEAGALSWTTP